MHRVASAIIPGEQYRAAAAVLSIHSFSEARAGRPDYQAFTRLFGGDVAVGAIQRLGMASSILLFGVSVAGNPAFLNSSRILPKRRAKAGRFAHRAEIGGAHE